MRYQAFCLNHMSLTATFTLTPRRAAAQSSSISSKPKVSALWMGTSSSTCHPIMVMSMDCRAWPMALRMASHDSWTPTFTSTLFFEVVT